MSDLNERPIQAATETSSETPTDADAPTDDITIRTVTVDDGAAIWRLVRDTGVLDLNSPYAYLLLCRRFADTCVVAERDGAIVGFVLGFVPPDDPAVIFVWQVGVDAAARGLGIAGRLLSAFVRLPAAREARWLETTVTPDNEASSALFGSFARAHGAEREIRPYFSADLFPGSGHEAEELHRIGPLPVGRA